MTNIKPATPLLIGVDFDNTLAIYDDVMHTAALELGLIDAGVARIKKQVRDTIRKLPGGEIEWQKLQGLVYGPRMAEAQVAEGATDFFQEWAEKGAKLHIVSHKTEFANYDETHTKLRESAMGWLEDQGFFRSNGLGLAREDVFWESTRLEKVNRVAQLGCTHFIDDLEEVFEDPGFPSDVEAILYAPKVDPSQPSPVMVARHWNQVTGHVLTSAKLISAKAQVPSR